MSTPLVWLVTGTSSGFGRELVQALLARGEKVIATARQSSISRLQDLKDAGADTLELDVTASLESLKETAEKAVAIHGRIDVLVNNAGYIAFGAMEENTPEETLNQFNTNVFGALNVTRAVLPYMRARKTGTIVFIGSIGGWRGNASIGLYCATKYTTRGIAESLHLEIAPLGLRALCLEAGYFRTEFLTSDHRSPHASRIADYAEINKKADDALQAYNGKQPGDPKKFVQFMIDVVRGEGVAEGKKVPVTLAVGSDCYRTIKAVCGETESVLEDWKDAICGTDLPAGQ
jgi:NAD(P)-dependent dehydrogenase (short-subunit alcohol dehydrogenase family)